MGETRVPNPLTAAVRAMRDVLLAIIGALRDILLPMARRVPRYAVAQLVADGMMVFLLLGIAASPKDIPDPTYYIVLAMIGLSFGLLVFFGVTRR